MQSRPSLDYETAKFNLVEATLLVQKSVFTELRTHGNPPEAVVKIVDVYAGMYNIESHDYAEHRNKLLGPNAHVFVKNYDVDSLSEQTLQSLECLVCNEDFTPEIIRNVSI